MDPDLLPGSGNRIIVPDPDPAKNERDDFIYLFILFVNLPYTNIHASHSQFSNPPGSDVNLTPKPDTTPYNRTI